MVQELLLILEDHWRRNKDMQGVPIYQASGLATKALSVYQAYIEMMNDDIRTAFDQVWPILSTHILSYSAPLSCRPFHLGIHSMPGSLNSDEVSIVAFELITGSFTRPLSDRHGTKLAHR